MIGRIRDRETFHALERRGRRGRRGPISVAYVSAESPDAVRVRVAFGVGRKLGHAVARNKVRRRLRHIMRELAHGSESLAPGVYLVTAQRAAGELSYAELRQVVSAACEAAQAGYGHGGGGVPS